MNPTTERLLELLADAESVHASLDPHSPIAIAYQSVVWALDKQLRMRAVQISGSETLKASWVEVLSP